jgi:hypothetical protein
VGYRRPERTVKLLRLSIHKMGDTCSTWERDEKFVYIRSFNLNSLKGTDSFRGRRMNELRARISVIG